MNKPMTDYINYKYAYEKATRPLTMADVNELIKRICIIDQEMKLMKHQLNGIGGELLSASMDDMQLSSVSGNCLVCSMYEQ